MYRHYGAKTFNPELVRGPSEKSSCIAIKLGNSLWGSPLNGGYSWKDWCEQESYNLSALGKFFDFTLTPDARIYQIRSVEAWEELNRRFPNKLPGLSLPSFLTQQFGPDWKRMSKEYDGIEVSITDCNELYYVLYGYDVDSIAVWNPDVVVPVMEKD